MAKIQNETLLIIFSVLTVTFGFFGNIISILIFKTKEFKKHSSTFYSLTTCVINIISVIYFPFAIIPSIWDLNDVNCKIYVAITLFIGENQSWVLAFCSLDRLAFTLRPTKFLFKNNLKLKISLCIAQAFIIFIMIIPCVSFYITEMDLINQTLCTFSTDIKFNWVLNYFKIQFF
jgi:hypothetical protein